MMNRPDRMSVMRSFAPNDSAKVMMPMEANSVAVSTPSTPRHQYSMKMIMPYLTILDSRRHTVSPRAPSTSASICSSHCATAATVTATQAYMTEAVMAKILTPRSHSPPRI